MIDIEDTDDILKLQRKSESKRIINQDPMVPHNMKGKDIIRAQDFNYLMVLGKGSFGKV